MIRNQQVGGSIPLAGSTIFPHIRKIISSLGQDRRSDHFSHVCPEYPEFCLSSGTNVAQGGGGILGCRTSSIRRVDYEEANNIKFAGVGRNDPCPCGKKDGNGKATKLKRCHRK